MDDLMNKVSALIKAHVKSEVEAREGSLLVAYGVIEDARKALGAGKGEGLKAAAERVAKERDTTIKQFEWMREERDAANRSANKYRTMREQLHRAHTEHLDVKEQLKELLSALGLAHFDRNTIEGAIKATRERDKALVAERDDAIASVQSWREKAQSIEVERDRAMSDAKNARSEIESWKHASKIEIGSLREKVQALEAKLLEVRKAVGGKDMVGIGDTVRCGYFTGVVTGFRANDGAAVVDHKNDRGNETRFIQPADLTVILPAP